MPLTVSLYGCKTDFSDELRKVRELLYQPQEIKMTKVLVIDNGKENVKVPVFDHETVEQVMIDQKYLIDHMDGKVTIVDENFWFKKSGK
jgi:pantothenate kinase